MLAIIAAAGVLIGLLGGLSVGRYRGRWCAHCGRTLDCYVCEGLPEGARP